MTDFFLLYERGIKSRRSPSGEICYEGGVSFRGGSDLNSPDAALRAFGVVAFESALLFVSL